MLTLASGTQWSTIEIGIFFLSFTLIGLDASDCLYNQCTFPPEGYHSPCSGLGNRQLIRSVSCGDGSLWHICCLTHQRDDIQKSRQEWFRKVTRLGVTIGPNCMRRILCEQSCKDGLSGKARSDYPEVLDTEMNDDVAKSYVQAYADGENLSCYGLVKSGDVVATTSDCESRCNETYSECLADMESNFDAQSIYAVSGIGHKLGMFLFNVVWWMDDGATWTKDFVKAKFGELRDGMNKLQQNFESYWEKLETLDSRPKRNADSEKYEKNWEPFLNWYNKTDPRLVEILSGQVTYQKFLFYKNVTEEIVLNENFENFPKSGCCSTSAFGKFAIALILFVGYF